MSYVGDRIRIPPKRGVKAWQALWDFIQASPLPVTTYPAWLKAQQVQYYEKQITHLERQRQTDARKLQLLSLRKALARLTSA